MRGDRLSLRMRLGVLILALTVLMPAAGGGLMAIQSVSGIAIVEALVGRAIFRTISHKREERRDRSAINERRDAELVDVAQIQQALDFSRDRGWYGQATYDQETARLVALGTGINERAKRERQVVSYQTRRNIRGDWTRVVEDVLTVSTGLNPRVIRFTGSLVRGERPIAAVVDAALGDTKTVDPRDQFRDLTRTLTDVKDGVRFVRDNTGLLARAQMTRMVREMTGLPVSTPEQGEAALERVGELGADVEAAVTQAGAIRNDLAPRSSRIDRERFAENEKWITLNDNVNALGESTAKKAVASAILRRAQERAEELLEGSAVSLTDEQLAAIAKDAAAGYADARLQDGKILDAAAVDMDQIVRNAANQALATAGQDPLPEPGSITAGTPDGSATATLPPTTTAAPGSSATATQTAAADGSPSPAGTGSSTQTSAPTSAPDATATPTPTPEPTAQPTPEPTASITIVSQAPIERVDPLCTSSAFRCRYLVSVTVEYTAVIDDSKIFCSQNLSAAGNGNVGSVLNIPAGSGTLTLSNDDFSAPPEGRNGPLICQILSPTFSGPPGATDTAPMNPLPPFE